MCEGRVVESIGGDSLVEEVVTRHPQTVAVFVRYRLHCPGCPMAPFHTVADSAHEFGRQLVPLLDDLNQVAANQDQQRAI